MHQKETSSLSSPKSHQWLFFLGILALVLGFPIYASLSLWYGETKGPFKNWTQVVDLNRDGDLDILISHTRWEGVDLSWAGVGRWINQGNGRFELLHDKQLEYFAAFAAGAGDADLDGDADVFVQDFGVRLLVNQGGQQGGEPDKFLMRGELNSPPVADNGYRDMGGTISTGDLNGDGRIDAVITGCCYGTNPTGPKHDYFTHAPSASWVWINDIKEKGYLIGHVLPLDFLDGYPIRESALGDVDGDGDLDMIAAVGKPTMGTLDSLNDLILLNDGTGRLTVFAQQLGNTDSTSVVLGDVNGDARLDILVGTSTGANIWINQSNNVNSNGPMFIRTEQSFEPLHKIKNKLQAGLSVIADKQLGLYLPYGNVQTKAVSLADFDGDQDMDALIARVWEAEIWWNNGQGEFYRSDIRFSYKEDTGVAVGDFDHDGDQDIFTGNNKGDYRVWFNDGMGKFKLAHGGQVIYLRSHHKLHL